MMVILDGLADEPNPALMNLTSFDYAAHPYLDRLSERAISGSFDTCPPGYLPESMPCILNLLGVPKECFPKSRAPLELLAHGIALESDEIVLRCNIVALQENQLISFNGGFLSEMEMKSASEQAAAVAQNSGNIRFIHLSGYRNLLVMKKEHFVTLDCPTFPPHEVIGYPVEELLNGICSASPYLKHFVRESKEIVKGRKGKADRYLFYPWGLSANHALPSFQELYGVRGAAVCGAEVARGIAKAMGVTVAEEGRFTGDTDTDLLLKARTACSYLENKDFVLVHINGLDEASHRCNAEEKVKFLERIDQIFMAYLTEELDRSINLFICADHATSPVTGRHSMLEVPYIIRSLSAQKKMNPGTITAANIVQELLNGE